MSAPLEDESGRVAAPDLLVVDELTVRYGGVVAVDAVSLTIREGELCGVIGPNGSGKSSLLAAMSRLVRPASGSLRWDSRDYTRLSPTEVIRLGIARTFQTVRLVPTLTVAENVKCGIDSRRSGIGLVESFVFPRRQARYERLAKEHVAHALERVGLAGFGDHDVRSLSYGRQRRLEIARALVSEPRLLLLDEPTAGMSESERDDIGELLQDVQAAGTSILIVDHNLRFINAICGWVYVMDLGECIARGTAASVSADPRVVTAYVGGA